MAYTTRYFAFGPGFHQETDPRMLEPGLPRVVENLRKLRNGRMGVRHDYSALAMTHAGSSSTLEILDLCNYNGRLLGLGTLNSFDVDSPRDVYEYVNHAQYGWRGSDSNSGERRLAPATDLRNIGRLPSQGQSISKMDVAAADGLVCLVFESTTDTESTVHIFRADTDASLLAEQVDLRDPRVVAVNGVFFIAGMNVAGTGVDLYSYDPANDKTLQSETALFAASGAITCWDMRCNITLSGAATNGFDTTTGFVAGIGRSGAVTIVRVGADGAIDQTITGPSVTLSYMALIDSGLRVHLAAVESDGEVDVYTYLVSSGALENSTTGLSSGATTERQPGIMVTRTLNQIYVLFEDSAGPHVRAVALAETTHTQPGARSHNWLRGRLNSKPVNTLDAEAFAGCGTGDGFGSPADHFLGIGEEEIQAAVVDVDLAVESSSDVIPQLARDSSTGKYYWVRGVIDGDGRSNPVVSELRFNSSDRRQTAEIGDLLYIAGAAPQVFDGRQLVEAVYQERPLVTAAVGSNGSGSLTNEGVYQLVAVWESYDAKGKRVQSAPSEVFEVTLGASDDTLTVTVTTPHSMRRNRTNQEYGPAVKVVIYSTVDTSGGNLTLHRSTAEVIDTNFADRETVTLTRSDSSLESQEVLYTQGARGALSGPLPFDAPQPCRTLAASADKLLSGGLPEGSRVEESRPQFINEQINWSSEIGFARDTRGDVLAVARLDERRIIFTATEIFEMDGPGLDDTGEGDLGAPRRLPSDVGIYAASSRRGLEWTSLVECSKGILFQGQSDMIYLLPRGGSSPQAIGYAVQDLLASYPNITAAVYLPLDQTARFTCNNAALDDAIVLVYDIEENEWYTEGPFDDAIESAARFEGRMCLLRGGDVYQQATAHPPSAFIDNAWRGATIHPFGHGKWGRIFGIHFFGEFRGNCQIVCIVKFDGGAGVTGGTTETFSAVSVSGLTAGDMYSHKWTPSRTKCESVAVEFEVTDLSGAATEGLVYNFWALDLDGTAKSARKALTQMS